MTPRFCGLLIGVLAFVPALCQTPLWLRAEIPFAFYAGDQAMEKGVYRVIPEPKTNMFFGLAIEPEGRWFAMAHVVGFRDNGNIDSDLPSQLVFLRYDGDHIFLKKIVRQGGHAVDLPKSRTEREHVTSRVISSLHPEVLTVIAQVR